MSKNVLVIVSLVIFTESVNLTILYPFIYLMCKEFAIVEDEKLIGYYVGSITAAFSFSQFLTNFLWGWISDKYGRRVVLLFGLFSNVITIICFGFSKTFLRAILSRIIGGLLNGNITLSKSILADITEPNNRTWSFSILGLMWGVGMIFGPVLGATLHNPAKIWNVPKIFILFPYLLPCLISALLSIAVWLLTQILLPETAQNLNGYEYLMDDHDEENELANENGRLLHYAAPSSSTPLLLNIDSTSNHNISVTDVFKSFSVIPNNHYEEVWDARLEGIMVDEMSVISIEDGSEISRSAYKTIFAFGLITLQNVIFEEEFSLWAIAPLPDGLSLPTLDFGGILSLIGILNLIFQLFLYPVMGKKWTACKMYRVTLIFYLVVWTGLPFVNYLNIDSDGPSIWIFLLFFLGLRRFAIVTTFTSINIMITQTTTNSNAGKIIGLAQTVGSLMRTIGPIIGGSIWSWSNFQSAIFHQFCVFGVLQLLAIITIFQSIYMDPQMKEPSEIDN